jgi:hypothetical protein
VTETKRALAFEGPRFVPDGGAPGMSRNNFSIAAIVVVSLAFLRAAQAVTRPDLGPWKAVEVTVPGNDANEACLGRPIGLDFEAGSLYVVDAQDCMVKIFSKDGLFLRAVGRKGRGPGELFFPSGVSVLGGRIFVADKSNTRIQVFDGEGRPLGGFPVPFAPDKILALAAGTIVVTSNPAGRSAAEKLLHVYDENGRPLWEGLPASVSSDRVFDAFRNMIIVCAGGSGDFFVVFRNGERNVLHFANSGVLLGKVPVDERIAFLPLDLPFAGPRKRLLGFCWAAAWDRGFLYMSSPEPVDGRDLGPGRRLSVIDGDGRLSGSIELPCPVHRFLVDGRRVFAVDEDGELRIFEVVR